MADETSAEKVKVGQRSYDEMARESRDPELEAQLTQDVYIPGWKAWGTVKRLTLEEEVGYIFRVRDVHLPDDDSAYGLKTLHNKKARENRWRMVNALLMAVTSPVFTFESAIQAIQAPDSAFVAEPLFRVAQSLNPVMALDLSDEDVDPLVTVMKRDLRATRLFHAMTREGKLSEAFGPDNREKIQPFLDNVQAITAAQLAVQGEFASQIAAALAPRIAEILGLVVQTQGE